jgi:hypothetical protein
MVRATVLARASALIATFALAAAACFIEPSPAGSFRYQCASNDECSDGDSCISGLCQRPCTFATASEDCPFDDGYATCFNGACASTCDTADDTCPSPLSCQTFEVPDGVDLSEFGISGFEEGVGVCGARCTDDADCPDVESCFEGICVDLSGGVTGTSGMTGPGDTGDSGTGDGGMP